MRFAWSILVVMGLLGCAEGASGTGDAGTPRRDSGSRGDGGDVPGEDGGRPRRDGGSSTTCDTGQHACGGGCIDDLANDPANGCRLGCGEACPAPPSGMVSCSAEGTCAFTCTPPFHPVGDSCECAPFTCEDMGWTCGAPDDGCGTPLDCGTCATGTCIDGTCACMPDGHEADDSSTTAPSYGSFDDAADPPDTVLSDHTLDDARDLDWMRFSITDGTDLSNPTLTVTLDQIPIGSDYDLSAFYVCSGGTDASTCSTGTADNEVGRGCTSAGTGASETVVVATECDHLSTDDSGTLYVRVRSATWGSTCDPYRVTLRVR